jgi:PAS domain S-box-containing protein
MTVANAELDRRGALLDCQRRILERIASGAPLAESLGTLVRLIEEQAPDMRCAVLLADAEGQTLSVVAAPNIPQDYKEGMKPFLRIAPNMGSCGTAAYLRQPVYTEDTATDPRWAHCRDVAVRNGLRAIWSTPIISDDNAVLGTFAMYYGEPRLPAPEHVQLIDMAVQLARVAIEGKQDEERLRASEEKFRLIAENATDLIELVDATGRRLYNSPSYKALYGSEIDQLRGTDFLDSVYAEDRPRVEREFGEVVRTAVGRRIELRMTSMSGELRLVQAEATPIKDASGQVTSVLSVGRDVTRKRARLEALRESEELLRTIVENAPAGVAIADLEHRLIRVNPAFARLVGYSEAELQGMPVDHFTHQADRPKNDALFQELLGGKPGPLALDKRYRRKDGTTVWVRATVALVRGPRGEPRATVASVEDISGRTQVEDHLRLVIDTIPAMAWSLRPDGALDFINRRWLEYTGLSFEEAVAEPTRTMHPEELPSIMQKWSLDIAAGQPYEGEMRLRRADGEYRWFLVRTVPLRNEQGTIVKWYGTSFDIEDRKRTADALRGSEQQLRHNEDRLRLVIDTVPAMVWTALPDGSVDFVNRRWLEYIGMSEAQFQASGGWPSVMHPDDLAASLQFWAATVASGQAADIEHRVRRADGQYRWLLARCVPLRDERGNIVKWYGTVTDIDDRKRAEQNLRQAATELQALSRRLVELQESERKALARELHDRLGGTLTALSINVAMLKEAVQADARATTRLEDSAALLKSTADTIENLVADLRPPMLDDYGLPAAIDWYARQFAQRVGVAVSVQATEAGERLAPEVEMALFRIAQEALNNVAKHARAEHVAITLWRAPAEFAMSVADDGIGLPRSAQPPERPGLGLVTMRERAQAVGGTFNVESLPDGGGTRLTVRLAL